MPIANAHDCVSQAPSAAGLPLRRDLLVGCGEWGLRNLPMDDHFRIAQRFGFEYLEFGIGGGQAGRLPESPSAQDVLAFRALGQRYKIQTPFCCIENDFTLSDPQAHERMLGKVLSQIESAADCGATHVRLFAGFTPVGRMTEPQWLRMIEAFERCDELCQRLAMVIAIETHGAIVANSDGSLTHQPTVTTDGQGLRRLLAELPGRIGINYDPGNLKAAGADGDLHLGLLNGQINYCHMKDWRRVGQGLAACAIGDDDLDYVPLLGRLAFNGVYVIEYEPLEDTEHGIGRSLDYLKRIVPSIRFR